MDEATEPPTLLDLIRPLGEQPDGSYRMLLDLTLSPADLVGMRADGVVDFEDTEGELHVSDLIEAAIARALARRLRTGEWGGPELAVDLREIRYIAGPDSGGAVGP